MNRRNVGENLIYSDRDREKFFDNIEQDILMKLVECRISDPPVLRLIHIWLKAGVMEEGKYIETDRLGTPPTVRRGG